MTDIDFGGSYTTGQVTLTNGSAVAAFSGTMMTTEAEVNDFLYINSLNLMILVTDVTDDTHLGISPAWGGTTVGPINYTLLKMSSLRYDPALTQAKTRALLSYYEGIGFFYFVQGAAPDPGIGVDGQWALKTNSSPWQMWYHTGGLWVPQAAIATGMTPKGAWSSATAYVFGDSVGLNGSSYICILANTNHTPPNATYWQTLADKGTTGPAAWNLPTGWVTGHAYVAGPPSDTVVQGNNTYVCLVSHTSGTFATDLAAGKWILAAAGAPVFNISSAASLTIGTGSKAFTGVNSNNAYQIGDYVRAKSAANGTNFMEGNVTANSGGTLTVNVTKVGGSGTFGDWNISPTGAPGTGDMLSTNNLADLADKKASRENLGVQRFNYVVNGGCQISQEWGTTLLSVSSNYIADQWGIFHAMSGGVCNFAQVASPTPGGSTHRLRAFCVSASGALGASAMFQITQMIEGYRAADLKFGTASAKNVVIQFGCKGPAGTYTAVIRNASVNRSYVANFTISGGEANTDVVKSVTIPGDTSGTWATDNNTGMYLSIVLACGTTFQTTAGAWQSGNQLGTASSSNVFATTSNTFELFDISMNEGTIPAPFQLRPIDVELPLCQRYWEKTYDPATLPQAVTANGADNAVLVLGAGTVSSLGLHGRFKATKRATPSMVLFSTVTGASGKIRDLVNTVDVTANVDKIGQNGFRAYANFSASAQGAIEAHWVANARMS